MRNSAIIIFPNLRACNLATKKLANKKNNKLNLRPQMIIT